MTNPDRRLISLAIPIFNEAGNVRAMHDRLCSVAESLPLYDFEIVFVDDGSRDASADLVSALSESDSRVKLVSFSRNFGHQAAIAAGLDYCRGDAVVTMDGDLQHPPEMIPDLLQRWEAGFDIVNTQRLDSGETGLFKRLTSSAYYRLVNAFSEVKIPTGSADFRLIDRVAVNVLREMRERDRFFRGMVPWIGFEQTSLVYVAAKRHAGTPKYTFRKMLSLALNGVFSFSVGPLLDCTPWLGQNGD